MKFSHEGMVFRYSIEGTGTATLVLGSPVYYPRTFSSNLKQNLQLIHLEHRGFAIGTVKNLPTMEDLLSDIEAFRKFLNLKSFILMGHSGHAYLALEFAKKYPEYVSHVVLIAAGPDLSATNKTEADDYFWSCEDPERHKKYQVEMGAFQRDIAQDPANEFIHFCKRSGAKSSYALAFEPGSLWEGMEINTPVVFHMWGKLFAEIDVTLGLSNFRRPVLIVTGLYDFLVPPFYTWNGLKGKFQNLTFKVFTKSGHHPQLEESELFDSTLLEWIRVHESS